MRHDVIVIGAGVAGLAAATALAERGARVCLVEARQAPGGRTISHRDPVMRESVDNGQHILMGCYRESFAFLRRIGTDRHVSQQDTLNVPIIDRHNRRSALVCPSWPGPWHLVGGILAWNALRVRDRLAAFHMGPAILQAVRAAAKPNASAPCHPDETVLQWLVRHGQTERLCELLWEPLALAALNQPAREAAAATFSRSLALAFGSGRKGSAIALPALPLSDVIGNPACAYLVSQGGTVRMSAPVRVVMENGKADGVALRSGDVIRASAIVSAVPWHALPLLFPATPGPLASAIDGARRMRACPIVSVNLWLDRPVLDAPFIGMPGREMQWIFNRSAVVGDCASHVTLVSSGAVRLASMGKDGVIALALSTIHDAFPGAIRAKLRHASVVRERRATFSVAPGEPERPGAETGVPGLYLAGDWTNTLLPGTIESAALSGHVAAGLIAP